MRASWVFAILLLSCGSETERAVPASPSERVAEGADRPSCPAADQAPTPLPRIDPRERTLEHWLARFEPAELDRPLMSPSEILAHNAVITRGRDDLGFARAGLDRAPSAAILNREVRERLAYVRERMVAGTYVDGRGERASDELLARVAEPAPIEPSAELRVAIDRVPLRCAPLPETLHTVPVDPAFDRNACSTIEHQEPVQILGRWDGGMLLARSRYALGWIAEGAPLSPPITEDAQREIVLRAPLARPLGTRLASDDGASVELDRDVLLPIDASAPDRAFFADTAGLHRSTPTQLEPVARPLTRRAFLSEAFRHLDRPYGWGGAGGPDCSELVMDVLASFGLEMPRHSGVQAQTGTFAIDLPPELGEAERLRLIDAASQRGVVLLHFTGHVMIWLGRTAGGAPRVLHSLGEYVEPCEGGGETVRRVMRVTVSDLELGRGSSRRALIERIERINVIGAEPGPELASIAARPIAEPVVIDPERCEDSVEVRVFQSPAMPYAGHPLRFIATSSRDLRGLAVAVRDPDGTAHEVTVQRLGGPPFTAWVEIADPMPGRWTFAIGDGEEVAACDGVTVARTARDASDAAALPIGTERRRPDPHEAIWLPRWSWEEDTENLYAAFVEQLFAYPQDDRTWRSLSELLRDREHNLLFDHLGLGEDSPESELMLVPDCADLPYFLRAYFAWKLRLPFAFRRCNRGRAGSPPTCGEIITTAMPHEARDDVGAFRTFIERHLRSGVHSASGRTAPTDSETDLYPVPLTREALRPGTVFADPYGHLLVISAWIPQGLGNYGVLVGADAQPDGTIGRRTFWRGTFLFSPDTTDVGAGFKAWRPVLYDRREDAWTTLDNEALRSSGAWSAQQYEGSVDDFYERMEALINPRPLDAEAMQVALIDALEESVRRRIVSIEVGEEYFARSPNATIAMPDGSDIFLTEGPWEDYSTPSRDMRLLVAIDTVVRFPQAVRRSPARFSLAGEGVERAIESVEERARTELTRRTFSYRRSDGQMQSLTLADLIARAPAIEIAWNPNDCPEVRWGAPEGSEEARSCRRRAPAEQRARMARMREWFAERRRPTR